MKKLLLATFCLLLNPVMAHAETKTYMEAEEQFHKADIIADGNIDPGEYDIYINQNYVDLDVDRDGFLTMDECLKDCFRAGHSAKGGVLQGQFGTIDMDGNGYISNFEYILFHRDRFQRIDADKNGLLNKAEFCGAYEPMRPCAYSQLPDIPTNP